MRARSPQGILHDQHGAALPMALIVLAMLSTLVIAFSILATTEPTIASNQQTVAQARAVAESGVERVTWALNNSTHANGIADPAAIPAPYDGSAPVNVVLNGSTLGVFRATVTKPAGFPANEWRVQSEGSIPSEASPRARQRVQVTVVKFRFPDPPAALSVRGELQMGGNTLIDSRADTSCGNKVGTYTTGDTNLSGSATVFGANTLAETATGTSVANTASTDPVLPTDIRKGQTTASFDPYLLTADDMAVLKAYAKAQGTYYQGTVEFSASNRMPNGILFIDSVSGGPVTNSSDPADMANVTIHGNAPASADGIFHGWLIVNGSLAISGNFEMHGFGYVKNDLTYTGTGTGQIVGAMLSENIQDTSSTTIDTNTGGNASILYDCAKARSGGGSLLDFTVKAGTYKDKWD